MEELQQWLNNNKNSHFDISEYDIDSKAADIGVEEYQCAIRYAQGKQDLKEFAYEMGEKAARRAGKVVGTAVGGVVGSRIPGVGTKNGALIGGAIGTAVAGAAYRAAVVQGSENVEMLSKVVKENANKTIELAKQYMPDKVEDVRSALNQFARTNNLPYAV